MNKTELEAEIKDALRAHGRWRLTLSTAAKSGHLPKPSSAIARDDDCPFGKWLYKLKADSSNANNPAFKSVMAAHAAFHQEAGRIAAKVEAGDGDGATKDLSGQSYTAASNRLVQEVGAWKKTI